MKNLLINKTILLVLILLLSIIIIYYYISNIKNNLQYNTTIHIKNNSTIEYITDTLYEKKIIRFKKAFILLSNKMKYTYNIKPGIFQISRNMSYYKIITHLRSGNQIPVKITFNSNSTHQEILNLITSKLDLNIDTLNKLLNNDIFLSKYNFNKDNIYCIFIPNTYYFNLNITEENFINRMYREYSIFWKKNFKKIDYYLDYKKIYILASIISKETNNIDEMKIIAGVYINRLKKGWKLQACPTIIYILEKNNIKIHNKKVLYNHLKIKSPYNTYLFKGLPPGPISIPTIDAIKSIIYYQSHKYYYFCISADNNSKHIFSTNLKDHNKNFKNYKKSIKLY